MPIGVSPFDAVGGSPPAGEMRSTFLAFRGDTLALPSGLELVDDLDTKPDGWDN